MPSHVSGSGVGSSQTARAREATSSACTPVDELAARALATGTTGASSPGLFSPRLGSTRARLEGLQPSGVS
eukprot:3635979-Alexandrium_andersonii.AAC.1